MARHLRLMPRERGARSARIADYSEWWLSPNPRWPSYRHSKLFLDRIWGPPGQRLPGLLRAGFTVARGFGRQAADLVPPALVIDAGWGWYRFLSDSMAGAFDAPIRSMLTIGSQPVIIDLRLYYFDRLPNAGGEVGARTPQDQVSYTISDESLAMETATLGGQVLAPLASVTSLRELALRIEGVQDLTWYWIDIRICLKAWYKGVIEEPSDAWDASTLWDSALWPWLPWVH